MADVSTLGGQVRSAAGANELDVSAIHVRGESGVRSERRIRRDRGGGIWRDRTDEDRRRGLSERKKRRRRRDGTKTAIQMIREREGLRHGQIGVTWASVERRW